MTHDPIHSALVQRGLGRSPSDELLINCRVVDPTGRVLAAFTIDHRNGDDRRYLGATCLLAFEAGLKVETWPHGQGFETD